MTMRARKGRGLAWGWGNMAREEGTGPPIVPQPFSRGQASEAAKLRGQSGQASRDPWSLASLQGTSRSPSQLPPPISQVPLVGLPGAPLSLFVRAGGSRVAWSVLDLCSFSHAALCPWNSGPLGWHLFLFPSASIWCPF